MPLISSNLTNRELILLIENNPEVMNDEAIRGLVTSRLVEVEATSRKALQTLEEIDRLGVKSDTAVALLSILDNHGLLDPTKLQTHFFNN
jgi:hypothetical protein